MADALDDYLEQSVALEATLVAYAQDLDEVLARARHAGDSTTAEAAEHLATYARGEIQRCLRARALYRRLCDRPQAELVLALCRAGLSDHASALVSGNWEPQSPAIICQG